eukprot:1375438-Amorphochlora_amoeboformis.AAC.1
MIKWYAYARAGAGYAPCTYQGKLHMACAQHCSVTASRASIVFVGSGFSPKLRICARGRIY